MSYLLLIMEPHGQRAGRNAEEGTRAYESMLEFAADLKSRGILRATESLKTGGVRVATQDGKRVRIDGPFAETKELVAGYTLIQTRTRDEALEWTRRFPNPSADGGAAEIEVRQLYELDDFGPSESIERFREIGVGNGL